MMIRIVPVLFLFVGFVFAFASLVTAYPGPKPGAYGHAPIISVLEATQASAEEKAFARQAVKACLLSAEDGSEPAQRCLMDPGVLEHPVHAGRVHVRESGIGLVLERHRAQSPTLPPRPPRAG